MKSSKIQTPERAARRSNFLLMALAVFIAVSMWYFVSVRDKIEAQVEVNLDYYGIPPNLVVTDGLITKIAVRLRGPETLLRAMPRQRINEAIDLSHIKKGENIVPLGGNELGQAFRAFDVVDIQPPRIIIQADTLMEKSVPVVTIEESSLRGAALTFENLTISPSTVILRGPENVVAGMTDVKLTIRLDPRNAATRIEQTLTLDTPSLVTATPPAVKVSYIITSGRTVVSRQCRIKIAGGSANEYVVEPAELTLMVEVPEALAKNASYLGQLEASVVPPPLDDGQSARVKLRFRLPEGMTLLNQASEEVRVTRKTSGQERKS